MMLLYEYDDHSFSVLFNLTYLCMFQLINYTIIIMLNVKASMAKSISRKASYLIEVDLMFKAFNVHAFPACS